MLRCFKKWFHKHSVCEYEYERLEVDSNEIKTSILSLPEDFIINILSRLPTKSVLECKRVVSLWNQLSSTPSFAETHLTNVIPLLLVEDRDLNLPWIADGPMYLKLRGCGKNARFKKVHFKYFPLMYYRSFFRLLCSCNGILIFAWPGNYWYVIYNPITLENFVYKEPRHTVIGFFFHELERDYKMLLYEEKENALLIDPCYYYLYGLRNKNKRRLGTSYSRPLLYSNFTFTHDIAVVCGVVFWMVKCYTTSVFSKQCSETIMMFDLMTEKLNIMPHPGSTCTRCFFEWDFRLHEQMRLLEMDGKLSLCNVCEKTIEVWILQDVNNWIWEKMYVVKLDCRFERDRWGWAHPFVAIHNGILLLNWPHRGIFWCNLAKNCIWKIKAPYDYNRDECSFYAITYTSSFVSFQNGM